LQVAEYGQLDQFAGGPAGATGEAELIRGNPTRNANEDTEP
jgi:hypothetical protein